MRSGCAMGEIAQIKKTSDALGTRNRTSSFGQGLLVISPAGFLGLAAFQSLCGRTVSSTTGPAQRSPVRQFGVRLPASALLMQILATPPFPSFTHNLRIARPSPSKPPRNPVVSHCRSAFPAPKHPSLPHRPSSLPRGCPALQRRLHCAPMSLTVGVASVQIGAR